MIDVAKLKKEELFEAPVVQFLYPNGRRRDTSTVLPLTCKPLFDEMTAAGCRLEAEILSFNGQVSMTISNPKEEEDVDISITPNGPEVHNGIVQMLERKLWLKPQVEES